MEDGPAASGAVLMPCSGAVLMLMLMLAASWKILPDVALANMFSSHVRLSCAEHTVVMGGGGHW